ncbi:hypothetical protein [Polyangium fumosum]|uniref:Uncharacterized protein n=1 Tax=Polyangium fumosum TaxID=889272 RepID=A0A4U1JK09_9BACT|nr:hypothetical protein [Polyangium fumosum]TKD12329.1 hypothetical protein E8A74_04290 [Polyangium fumosum]
MLRRALLVLCMALGSVAACNRDVPVPAASDPDGKDLVQGAVVAATESSGGIRLYKIIHVDDYPEPAGPEYHMIAYNPKVPTFQDAANLWKHKRSEVTVAIDHIFVRLVSFGKRDHRVLFVEPVTDEERAPYLKAKR